MEPPGNPEPNLPPLERIIISAVHDMRTPLSTLRTTLEIFRMLKSNPEKTLGMVEIMERQVIELSNHLDALIDQSVTARQGKNDIS